MCGASEDWRRARVQISVGGLTNEVLIARGQGAVPCCVVTYSASLIAALRAVWNVRTREIFSFGRLSSELLVSRGLSSEGRPTRSVAWHRALRMAGSPVHSDKRGGSSGCPLEHLGVTHSIILMRTERAATTIILNTYSLNGLNAPYSIFYVPSTNDTSL